MTCSPTRLITFVPVTVVLVYHTLSDRALHAGVNRLMHVNLEDGSRSRFLVVYGKSRTPAQGHGTV